MLFRSEDAGVDLSPADLEWLVVAPNGEVGVKGTGSFDGEDVGFILYGYQGCGNKQPDGTCQPGPDRFRAIIWPAATGDAPGTTLVYDNRPGVDFELADADPQALGGGNISIH